MILLERTKWDTSQWHLLAANTWPQLQAVTGEIYKWWDLAGVEHVFNSMPPEEWREEWRSKGIKTPSKRDRYTNCVVTRAGLHLYLQTLLNQNFKNLRGWEFGSIIIEEFTAGPSQAAVEYAMERARCGIGKEECRRRHRHTKYLKGNPPDDDGHWVYDWLAAMDRYASTLPGGVETKHADTYPNILKGIGPVLYIPSQTKDNEANLSDNYLENQLARLDDETAKKRLGGVLSRRRSGRAYNKWSNANEWPIEYHQDRDLALYFDFNTNPTVAGVSHRLKPGEYPDQGGISSALRYDGIFGEYFHIGGMDAHELAIELIEGKRGSDGYFPKNWSGLKDHQAHIYIYGDATAGARRTMTGTNPWKILREPLQSHLGDRVIFRVPKHNGPIQNRLRSVNGRLCSAAGFRTLFADPNCDKHIHDFDAVQLAPDGTILKPGGPRAGSRLWLLTHISDALGYFTEAVTPLGFPVDPLENVPDGSGPPRTSIPSFIR